MNTGEENIVNQKAGKEIVPQTQVSQVGDTQNESKKPETTPTVTPVIKPTSFFITLETDEFLNYVGWQLEQYKSISIALDDKVTAIERNQSLLPFL